MVSRVGLALALLLAVGGTAAGSPNIRQPPSGTAMYVVDHDRRSCPRPHCGGYWVVIVNGVRTHCVDGLRHRRCHVARAVDGRGRERADVPEGALVRGAMDRGRDARAILVAAAAYSPAGTAAVSGGFYRIRDNGTRCVRAPCFSYTVTPVNATTRGRVSSLDLEASGASAAQVARALRTVGTRNGLYARGRFAPTPDGGKVFLAFRIYLRAPLPLA